MRLKRVIGNRLFGLWGDIRPGSLQIEVTNACNFRCLMCPFHGPENTSDRPIGFMEPGRYREVVRDFRDFGGSLVIPQGAGESFLHPEFPELLEFTKRTLNLSVGFNTNGARVTRDHLRLLIDLGIDEIGFSVDALTPGTFKAITGGDLEPVEQTVKMLVDMRRSMSVRRPLIRVLLVAQESNQAEIDDYIRRWLPVVDEIVIQSRRIQAGRVLEKPRIEPRRPCRHLFDTAFVQWDGEMVICCEDWESVSSVGNVFESGFRSLWRSRIMKTYRSAQRRGDYSPPAICRDCQAWAGGLESRRNENGKEITMTALTRVIRRGKESA
ncbi:radical SAM protein [bacterium]|nr:radical SAM protein [candidate division CSSED10-310 bacterium]